MKKLYIFDFDGTLVNTFYDSVLAYNEALRIHNMPEYEYESLESVDFNHFIENMVHDEKVLKTYQQRYNDSNKEHTLPYTNVKEVLGQLIENGCEVAICSNRVQQQIDEYAEKLFSGITFTFVIGYQPDGVYKPYPEMINKILDNVNYDKREIVYVGDKLVDVETARNVDIDCVIVTWGQGDEAAYTDEYPLCVIDKIDELLEI